MIFPPQWIRVLPKLKVCCKGQRYKVCLLASPVCSVYELMAVCCWWESIFICPDLLVSSMDLVWPYPVMLESAEPLNE